MRYKLKSLRREIFETATEKGIVTSLRKGSSWCQGYMQGTPFGDLEIYVQYQSNGVIEAIDIIKELDRKPLILGEIETLASWIKERKENG